jgi:uncharacterized membrane protein YjjP (DUF1212 family)
MRLEEALERCSARLGLRGQFLSTPTSLLFGFGVGPAQRLHLTRIEPGDVDLGMLADLDEVIEGLLLGHLDADGALDRLAELEAAPRRYPRWTLVPGFALASGTAAVFFGGGGLDAALASLCGLLIGGLALLVGKREQAALVFETFAALIAASIGVVADAGWPEASSTIITLSGLIVLVPGLTLTVAMNELAARHLVAGTARLSWAATVLISIGLGVAGGHALQRLLPPLADGDTAAALPAWASPVALLLAPAAFAVLFKARRRDLPWVLLAGWIGFGGARLGASLLGPVLGVSVGALVVGLASNLYARTRNQPASILQVPGIMLLVPGSFGFRSVSSFLQRDILSGVQSGFDMAQTAGALVGGLLLANALLPPRRSL